MTSSLTSDLLHEHMKDKRFWHLKIPCPLGRTEQPLEDEAVGSISLRRTRDTRPEGETGLGQQVTGGPRSQGGSLLEVTHRRMSMGSVHVNEIFMSRYSELKGTNRPSAPPKRERCSSIYRIHREETRRCICCRRRRR